MLKNKNHTVIAFIKETTKVNQFLPSSVMFIVIFFFLYQLHSLGFTSIFLPLLLISVL